MIKTFYNFYPKYYGTFDTWKKEFKHIKNMGFNYLYINPVNFPGESKSDYSIIDFYSFNPLYVYGEYKENSDQVKKDGEQMFRSMIEDASKEGLDVIFDIVINHCAIDSPLIDKHPTWFTFNEDGSAVSPHLISDSGEKIYWSDVAEINNKTSIDKQEIWQYWVDLFLYYCKLGIKGFRCDAVFFVPLELWEYLISEVKKEYPNVFFVGETLGCDIDVLKEVGSKGFDYIMTSYKWWDLKQDFFVDDYKEYCTDFKSMSFTENHDTIRAFEDASYSKAYTVSRYLLAACISEVIAITSGQEYLMKEKIVLQSDSLNLQKNKEHIIDEITKINKFKQRYDLFTYDAMFTKVDYIHDCLVVFKMKRKNEEAYFIVNTDLYHQHMVYFSFTDHNDYKMISPFYDGVVEINQSINISPGGFIVLYRK